MHLSLKEMLFVVLYYLLYATSVGESETLDIEKRLLVDSQQFFQTQLDSLHKSVQALQQQVNQDHSNFRQTGSVFTIWGRKTCPTVNGTEMVYSGITGGGLYNEKGSGANTLCLPHDPDPTPSDFPSRLQAAGYVGHIFGSEYQFYYKNIAMEDDVPCAVCKSRISSSALMIPAKTTCPLGWTKQFSGFLTTSHYDTSKSDYICVDGNPEYFEGSRRIDDNGHILYPVQARCGSLPCPPYINAQYISCVVCTE